MLSNISPFSLGFFAIILIVVICSVIYVEPEQISSTNLELISNMIPNITYTFLAFALLITGWIIFSIRNQDAIHQIYEFIAVIIITIILTVLFALSHKLFGLYYQGEHIYPTAGDSIYFSINILVSNGFGEFLPNEKARSLVAAEGIMGLLLVPILLSLLIALVQNNESKN